MTTGRNSGATKANNNERPIALSFFSGAMGLDLGIERAGFHIALSCDSDRVCQKTIKANRPDLPVLSDIRDYSPDAICGAAGVARESVDLIVGGPPCQSFSTAGARRGLKDDRGHVILKFIDMILAIRPRYAVLENVRGLLSAPLIHRPHAERGPRYPELSPEEQPGGVLLRILKQLRGAGYGVSFNLYNAANFGTPQIRERVVVICHREGEKLPYLSPTHACDGAFDLPAWRTFADAVVGLEDTEHHHVDFPEERLRFYRILGPGQYWKHLPVDLQEKALGKAFHSGGGKTGFLRRLAWDKPSPTVVTNPAMPATDLAHPEEDRPLSVEEYKRLQEFPDDWVVCGSLTDQYRQIGNAVPVGLGVAVGRALLAHMAGEPLAPPKGFPFSRYRGTDHVTWEERTRAELSIAQAKNGRKTKQRALF